ncbi:tagaturonate reductase [Acetonema longum]|uniref:Altronate oxidoreductase n=1 Tax=Acetonema longum DSM 6540 TaxID=1009370 RepID=F7NJ99_9FIRM|nr:tagaturonate reductase [Acetonema longum]EGO63847.1 altronate oxidoreductase [Acetonema longum DSM 6540]
MEKLSASFLRSYQPASGLAVGKATEHLPERVLQFGEGNFLRAFVDSMIHQLNQHNLFNGRVVVVQPIAEGLAGQLNEQNGLYTLLLRGLQGGKITEHKEIIAAVSRGLNPYTQWEEVLQCAENPSTEFIVSNTTEAGIVFDPADKFTHTPPVSFPGKLTAYLYRRYTHFQGDPAKGLIMLPCELIDRNGDNLKSAVLRLAAAWNRPAAFSQWVENCNTFANTLVDRVVTGYPRDEAQELQRQFGYIDELMDTGEIFHLWVIEGPQALSERLPFHKIGLDVIWTNDMTPYRTRKVRILNGAHTSSVPAAFLYGLETVQEMMEHPVTGKFIRQIMQDEILPSLEFSGLDKKMLNEFSASVVERFENPFIKHYLLSILLNSSSKFKARVLPSILEYAKIKGTLPKRLVFSLSALLFVYKDGVIDGTSMKARRPAGEFIMKDDLPVLQFMAERWSAFDGSSAGAAKLAKEILANEAIWGENLNRIAGLTEMTGHYLHLLNTRGMQKTIAGLIR